MKRKILPEAGIDSQNRSRFDLSLVCDYVRTIIQFAPITLFVQTNRLLLLNRQSQDTFSFKCGNK